MEKSKIERTFVVGDQHGCYEEAKELLKLLDFGSPRVKIICLGDFLDRGPDSVACVRLARELNISSVAGNHEIKLLKWLRRTDAKKEETLLRQPHYYQFSQDDIDWMSSLPYYIKAPEQDAIVVHAGVKPYLPIERQSREDLCYLRYTDKNGKFVSIRKIHEVGSVSAANAVFWVARGPFTAAKSIYYGHSVYEGGVHIDRFDDGSECIGVDTGCCFGMSLSAICMETKEVISVKAKRVYYEPGFKIQ